MMIKAFSPRFQSLVALALVATFTMPVSVSAESRPRAETDMRRLAAELEQALRRVHGANASVEVEGDGRPRESRTAPAAPAAVPVAQAIVDEMNRYRRQYGLSPLRLDPRLTRAAGDRIDDMFSKRYFDHVAPDGTEPFVWAGRRGYRYMTIGENLASGQKSVREVVADWMNSPGHRANILGRQFDDCGIAVAAGAPVGRTRGYTFAAFYASQG